MKEIDKGMFDVLKKSAKKRRDSLNKYYNPRNEEIGEENEIEFLSNIVQITNGEEDLTGKIWNRDWSPFHALVNINGAEKIYSFGGMRVDKLGEEYPGFMLEQWINAIAKYNVDVENMKGTKWKTKRLDDWNWEITLLENKKKVKKKTDKNKIVKEYLKELIESGDISEDDDIKVKAMAIYMSHPDDFNNTKEVIECLK